MAKPRKPTPKMLGTGAARRVGEGLAARGRRIDAAVDAATGAKPFMPKTSKKKGKK